MNKDEFQKKYWRYYLMLEEDFNKTIKFVEVDTQNFETYSVEYTKQYQSICSEIDVICKSICNFINPSQEANNIKDYANIIISNSNITERIVKIEENEVIELNPFKEWNTDPNYKSPEWWTGYNKVKHNRINNYKVAKLKNVLNALCGLFILEMYFIEIICKKENSSKDDHEELVPNVPDEQSKIFKFINWKSNEEEVGKRWIDNMFND